MIATNRSSDERNPSPPKSDSDVSSAACRSSPSASTTSPNVTLGLLDIFSAAQHQGPAGEVLHVVTHQRGDGPTDIRFTIPESTERCRLHGRGEGFRVPVPPFLRGRGHRAR